MTFPKLMSSWFRRSKLSTPGGVSGTSMDDSVIPGLTSAPGVHGPVQFAAYLVVGVICQAVAMPEGVLTFKAAVPSGLPAIDWSEPLARMPHGSMKLPATFIDVLYGMPLSRWSQNRRLFGFQGSSHTVMSVRSVVTPPKSVAPRGSRALRTNSNPLYHCLRSE